MSRLLPLLVLVLAAPLTAQQPPRVQPGGVVTLVARVEAAGDTAAFALSAAEGVRLYAAASGRAAAEPGEAVLIPLTFGIPGDAPAGPFVVAELELTWPGGGERRALMVEVAARRAAELTVDRERLTASPGDAAEVRYHVRNRGNAADTFHVRLTPPSGWSTTRTEAVLVLAAGASADGAFRARVPAASAPGQEHQMRLVLEGSDVRERAAARVTVVTPESAVGNLATVPATVFVGSTTDGTEATAGVALSAAGVVRPGLRASLDVRHAGDARPAQAFRGALSGPRFRIGLDGGSWTARAGDLFSMPDLVGGPATQAQGVDASIALGAWRGEVMVGRPWAYGGLPEDGHVARAGGRVATPYGAFGLRAATVSRSAQLIGGYEQSGAAFTYAVRRGGHDLQAEAGLMRVSDEAGSAEGGAGEIRYALNRGRASIAARLRRVPATTSRTASHGNESFVTGSYAVTSVLAATASAYSTSAPRLGGGPFGASSGASAGVRLGLPGGFNARILGAYRSNEYVGSGLRPADTRSVSVSTDLPLGPVVVELDTDLGVVGGERDRTYRSARAGGRWSGPDRWLWLGLSHRETGYGQTMNGLDIAGSARFRGAELQGGLNARLSGGDRARNTSFWSVLAVPVTSSTSVSVGAEYRGYALDAPWRLSVGARRSFGLPLPVARQPVVQGIIFHDLDGDGIQGRDEPAVPGIGVIYGPLRTTTDADGRFRFYDATSGQLRVDASDLPLGVALADDARLPSRGTVSIPLVPTANVELRIFLDRNGDGRQDPGEESAAGAIVSLIDSEGLSRDARADAAGRARFTGLPPGNYRVLVQRPNGRMSGAPVQRDIVLQPGANDRVEVGLPIRDREIRIRGASLDGEPAAPTPAIELAAADADPATDLANDPAGAQDRTSAAPAPREPRQTPVPTGPGPAPRVAADSVVAGLDDEAPPTTRRADRSGGAGSAAVERQGGAGMGRRVDPGDLAVVFLLLAPGLIALGLRYGPGRPPPPPGLS